MSIYAMGPRTVPRDGEPVIALMYDDDAYVESAGLVGRRVAGRSFLEAYLAHGRFNELVTLIRKRSSTATMIDTWRNGPVHGGPERSLRIVEQCSFHKTFLADPPATVIHAPQPPDWKLAWARQQAGTHPFCLTGVTHTLCSIDCVTMLREMVTSPYEPYDAMICTSRAVVNMVRRVIGSYAEFLRSRFGGTAAPERSTIRLEMIPLGVDMDRFRPARSDERALAREELDIAEDEVLVLFVGRLAHHAKAHPFPLFRAASEAARLTGRRVHLVLAGWPPNPSVNASFREGARQFAPEARTSFVDGRDDKVRRQVWQAADLFVSPSDNIQETFGLAVIEAMACGLPVVATDWDGYRDLVVDGETGLLVPAMMMEGATVGATSRYLIGELSYDYFVSECSQATAVDVPSIVAAVSRLVGDESLRRKMGAAGRRRRRSSSPGRRSSPRTSGSGPSWTRSGSGTRAASAPTGRPGPGPTGRRCIRARAIVRRLPLPHDRRPRPARRRAPGPRSRRDRAVAGADQPRPRPPPRRLATAPRRDRAGAVHGRGPRPLPGRVRRRARRRPGHDRLDAQVRPAPRRWRRPVRWRPRPMKRTEDQSPLLADVPGLESTADDSRPNPTSAAETGDFTPDEPTGQATGEGMGVNSNATAGFVPSGPTPDITASPRPVDATTDFDPGATADHDPDAAAGADRDATGDYDPDATDGFVHSPGVAAADTEEVSRSGGGLQGGELPRITGYQILGVLGAGGMGIVYKARQARLDRLVALKMILAGAGARPGDLARFEAEARAVAAIDHPNIIKIFEIGEHDGLPYFSLEFLEGGSLSQRIAGKPQPVEDAARIVETLAQAMDVAHRRGIVHRDIKPANVLLAGDGTPKIADFGLVKRLETDSGQTRSGSILGSPSYMAPEQTTGAEKAGPAADQYALGATLYEMLTGSPPFRGISILDTLDLVRTKEPVPPSQLLPRMPRDLETICLKALQKDPARRYSDVGAMAEDLRRFRAGEPIIARPVGRPERLWRWCRRNPRVAALAAAVVLLVAVGLVGATAAAVVIAGKNRELSQVNVSLVAANNTAENRRIEAEKARKRAEDEKRLAVAAGRAAIQQNRDVVEAQREMIFKLEDKWRNTPALQEVRRDVLGLATRILESAANTMTALRSDIGWPAEDEELNWRSVGLAHQRIGEVKMADNQLAEADKEFRINNDICERVAAAHPENLEYQNRLVRSCRQLGVFTQHSMADSKGAMRLYQRALEIARKCVAQQPDSDEYKADLADTLGLMARVESASGHLEPVRLLLDEVRAVRESCSAAWKAGLRNRRDLAILYDQLFDVYLRLGDPAAARAFNERGAELTESVLAERPQNFGILYNLVRRATTPGCSCTRWATTRPAPASTTARRWR